jgi:hypothetical protein
MANEHANPARAIYGTILVMAVITALSHDDSVTSAQLIAGVLATTLVFWVAHVYAEVLGRRVAGEGEEQGRPRWAHVVAAARGEWPLVEAALLPVLALLVGLVGLVETQTAVWIATGAGVVELFAYGIAAGRRLKLSVGGTVVVGVVNGALGLVIVALKVLVH